MHAKPTLLTVGDGPDIERWALLPTPSTADRGRCRDEYDWPTDERVADAHGNCTHCRTPADTWTTETPCCGGEHDCVTTVQTTACHHCRIIADSF